MQLEVSSGQVNDAPMAELLHAALPPGADVIADEGYDADWIRDISRIGIAGPTFRRA